MRVENTYIPKTNNSFYTKTNSDNTVSPYGVDITWTLLRTMIRKQKIKKIYGTENTDRKEKF